MKILLWIVIICLVKCIFSSNVSSPSSIRPTCTCDLMENLCDNSCCFCDPDCDEEFRDVVGPCKDQDGGVEDPNPFLTQVWNTSSYLGHVHEDPSTILSLAEIYIYLPSRYSPSSHKWNSNDFMRISGNPLRTAKGDFLFLPQSTFGGECATNVPIRYLRGFQSSCSSTFQVTECRDGINNRFNPFSYLKPSRNYKLLIDPDLDTDVPIHIEYNLSKDPSSYLDQSSFPRVPIPPFKTSNHTSMNSKDHAIKLTDNFCTNVVLEAHYQFVWKGSNISSLRADILLGKLPLSLSTVTIHQFFSVTFSQAKSEEAPNRMIIRRGLRVPIVDIANDDKYLSTYSTMSSKDSCKKGSTEEVTFGENVFTACSLLLFKEDFRNCSALREEIESSIIQPLLFTSIYNEFVSEENTTTNNIVNVTYQSRDLSFNDSTPNVCKVPIHFQVEILYINGQTPHVLGVKLSVENDYLKWQRLYDEEPINFEFFHSVHFQETPVFFKEENYSRFWRKQSVGYCSGESCWKGIFFLFTEVDELELRTKWTLVLWPTLVLYLWYNKSIIFN